MPRPPKLSLDALAPFLFDVPHPRYSANPAMPPILDLPALFGNAHPVELEVGFGKGLYLLNESLARPDVNFLGIEIERKYVLATAGKLAKAPRQNVKLLCTDARWYLEHGMPPDCLQAVHVYFPDPWWKNRHQKRKLFTREFAERALRVLVPGGELHFVTDVQDYFTQTLELLTALPALQPMPIPQRRDAEDLAPLTNFERKYRVEGRAIWQARYAKA